MVDVGDLARFVPGERTLRFVMDRRYYQALHAAQQVGDARVFVDFMLDMILRTLKDAQLLRRIGPDKGGHWEVVE